MIKPIIQSNCVIPTVTNSRRGIDSSANFTAQYQNNASEKEKKSNNLLWTVVGLAAMTTVGIIAHKQIEIHKLKVKISKSFDEVWKNIVKDIDTNKFQIEKPKLEYFSEENKNSSVLAYYCADDNVVRINFPKFQNDEYIVYNYDKKLAISSGNNSLFPASEIEVMRQKGEIDNSWTIKKVSDKEKMLNLASIIAHEQRHCVQYHYLLNDADYGADYILRKKFALSKEINQNLSKEEIETWKKINSPYLFGFKPKKQIRGLNMPTNIIYNNKRFSISTKSLDKHNALSRKGKESDDKYALNLLEIDANAFAANYLKKHPEHQKGCDKIIAQTIVDSGTIMSSQHLEKVLKRKACKNIS